MTTKRATKKKPTRISKLRKPGGNQGLIDWEAAREFYVTTANATYDDVRDKFGGHPSTVRQRGAKEDWSRLKAQFQAQAMEEALRQAMENRARGADALTKFSYQEAMAALSQLSNIRRAQAVNWSPSKFCQYARALDELVGVARVAMGLPREITADLKDASAQWEDLCAELEAEDAQAEVQVGDHENL